MKCTEIYPYICVYSDVFTDVNKIYESIKFSEENSSINVTHLNWSKWHVFGTYSYTHIDQLYESEESDLEQERKTLLEIHQKRQDVLKDYCAKYSEKMPKDYYTDEILVALKYDPNTDPEITVGHPHEIKAMQYHTDFQVKDIERPGENFLVTCNIYFNDNYDGGEILFTVGDNVFEYHPKAGDVVVMPSGSPEFPGNEPYFHAVGVVKNGYKFFSRNFIKYINKGSEEWLANQQKYGVEEWDKMEAEREETAEPVSLNCMYFDKNGVKVYHPVLDKYYWK